MATSDGNLSFAGNDGSVGKPKSDPAEIPAFISGRAGSGGSPVSETLAD